MSAKFLEGFSGKFAEQWIATLLTPAFVFWTGGAVAALQKFGWQRFSNWFISLSELIQIVILFGVLLMISISAFFVQKFDLAVLRLLEGYKLPQQLSRVGIRRQQRQRNRIKQQLADLNNLGRENLSPVQSIRFFRLDVQLQSFPKADADFLPTRLGNILRAAELRSGDRYGLDAIICWTHLWLLLPDAPRADLNATRADLNAAVRVWLWCLLFILWYPILGASWALLGAVAAVWVYYAWILDAASLYAELINATFDSYRHLLYQAIRFPLPATPKDEKAIGLQVTEYLFRGKAPHFPFTPSDREQK